MRSFIDSSIGISARIVSRVRSSRTSSKVALPSVSIDPSRMTIPIARLGSYSTTSIVPSTGVSPWLLRLWIIVPKPMGSSEVRHSSISGSQRGWLRTWSSAKNLKTAATGRSISCETSILTVDRALEQTFSRYAIDPVRLAIGGFSDGASYALSLGITNGDLFTHVLAFSPGLMAPAGRTGSPRIFVSHGVRDGVLPIDRCSRSIVPELKRGGYDMLYREFDGEHSISLEIALEAIGWFTQQKFP